MKKVILLISVIVFTGVSVFAQLENASKELLSEISETFGNDKRAIVASQINLQGEDSVTFWNLYEKFDIERKELGSERFEVFKKYQANYGFHDDKSANALIKEMMQIVAKDNKRIISHHTQLNKALGGKIAGQFYQIEMYLQATVRQFYFNMSEHEGDE